MIHKLRKPFFIAALVLLIIVVLLELGNSGILQVFSSEETAPGLAISYMALLDGILLFTIVLMAMSLLLPDRIHGRIQGIITLIFSFILLLASGFLILIAFAALMLKVGLFVAIPFGTLIYLATYGFFNTGGAATILTLLMTLKIAFIVCILLAHQGFIKSKGLVFLTLTSFLGNVIVGFLHGIFPVILVSITDTIAAIIVAILAVFWAIFLFFGSIGPVIKAIRLKV